MVTNAAARLLENKLRTSRFGEEEYIALMVDEFEKKVCSAGFFLYHR